MKKILTITLILTALIIASTLGFAKYIGNTYVYGKSAAMDTLLNFLRITHAMQLEPLEEEELKALAIIADEMKKLAYSEDTDSFQVSYMEKKYNNIIRSVPVKEGDKAEAIPVLMYHHLLYDEENTYIDNDSVITVESFAEQMKLLHENGYRTITLNELEAFLIGDLELPKKTVAITFDDGYLSNIAYAYPILKEYNFKASNFIISHKLKEITEEFDPYQLQYLGWKDMVDTLDVFTYDNHTHDLHRVEDHKGYLVIKPLEEVVRDLSMNMELMGSPYFAYPYGQYNTHTLQILERLGMRMAFTVKRGHVKPGDDLLQLQRYGICPKTTIEDFKKIIDLH
ncbi:Polysaccharide deacetylase [Anaerovirgula multivorans]|uniref:Polysaccharide deacetylase n=1 Tax=Anaerovirgula multivorans TaxID=312168 RepID=A0A239BT92_9FIRM|nr:polysaccharide deacetylase family protein [Anaerovirgula multivorans]SNS11245.1 Polysaccharide deacetylase [Anaerovirgula multivorans]